MQFLREEYTNRTETKRRDDIASINLLEACSIFLETRAFIRRFGNSLPSNFNRYSARVIEIDVKKRERFPDVFNR